MTFSVGLFRTALLLLAGCVLGGCAPSAPGDEEREPYFLAGKGRVNSMDYEGAVKSFEKAVEVNPNSAPAHFELAVLYDTRESDPAAAIYHYQRFLELLPNSGKADMVKTRILACKQQLAQTVYVGASDSALDIRPAGSNRCDQTQPGQDLAGSKLADACRQGGRKPNCDRPEIRRQTGGPHGGQSQD
jgi:tetratricopeptide (TPR) repeat protein